MESSKNNLIGEIVIIDDTPANLRLLASLLSDRGYQVRPFPSGKLALAGLERCDPDLILLDIQMPQMDGYEVCKILKAQQRTRDIPIIFISALSEALDKVKAFSCGGVDYITKPFQAEEVIARVGTHIKLSHLQQQLQHQNSYQASQLIEQNKKLQTMNQELLEQYHYVKEAQLQLVQAEKMATLGNLISGVAHEVNNPLGCINANLQIAQDYITELLEFVKLSITVGIPSEGEINQGLQDFDLEFIQTDLPQLLDSILRSTNTIRDISDSLRIFSRIDNEQNKVCFNIHAGLDSTLLILRYRLKANHKRPEIQVIKEYGAISDIECFPGKLNQVFMNILANVIDAFEEANQNRSYNDIEAAPNQIWIRTMFVDGAILQIEIQDNGPGMSATEQTQVFNQGFTTKPVGKGTGLGLAIARHIIEVEHSGSIDLHSVPGEGSTFKIGIPIV
ncbi:MAG: hybrid sensor histidine kinase/response regulator [Oscillatoriales cyanobacterium]|nr:MAG: hybrid sensor histidine kinase/response regulator [Oscillatoriales cyanobacterium]